MQVSSDFLELLYLRHVEDAPVGANVVLPLFPPFGNVGIKLSDTTEWEIGASL